MKNLNLDSKEDSKHGLSITDLEEQNNEASHDIIQKSGETITDPERHK